MRNDVLMVLKLGTLTSVSQISIWTARAVDCVRTTLADVLRISGVRELIARSRSKRNILRLRFQFTQYSEVASPYSC